MMNRFIDSFFHVMRIAIKFAVGFIIGCCIACIFIFVLVMADIVNPGIEVGQVWRVTYDGDDNPFNAYRYGTRRVIDIQDGYVQYVDSDGDTSSRSTSTFYYYGKLVK